MITTKNNTAIYTEQGNVIITYKILGYELITLNLYENTEIVSIYRNADCLAICTFYNFNGNTEYRVIYNTYELPTELLDEIFKRLENEYWTE